MNWTPWACIYLILNKYLYCDQLRAQYKKKKKKGILSKNKIFEGDKRMKGKKIEPLKICVSCQQLDLGCTGI